MSRLLGLALAVSLSLTTASLSAQTKRSWGPEQATGKPDTYPRSGDSATAWASRNTDDQEEWLLVEFDQAVVPRGVKIYESFNPGAVFKITAVDDEKQETPLWMGKDPTPRTAPNGISAIKLTSTAKVKRLKIYLDSKNVPGWNEIDAVELVDADNVGQFAVNASASSTFADITFGATSATSGNTDLEARVKKLEAEVEALKQQLNALRAGPRRTP